MVIVQAAAGAVLPQGTASSSSNLDGFRPQARPASVVGKRSFAACLAPASAREHLRRLTAEPHVAGTKEDYATAIYVRDQIRSYGIPAELKEYEVLLPYPKQPSIVELVQPRRERLTVKKLSSLKIRRPRIRKSFPCSMATARVAT